MTRHDSGVNSQRMRVFFVFGLLLAATACTQREDPLAWVDPTLGSGGHGHVFVGASVPFGMAQPGPTSIPQGWDWSSGYHASDSTVIGFSQTHLSGTGCADLFDITVMPVTGPVRYGRGTEGNPDSGFWSYADRTREIAQPGYYSVPLQRYGILAEMTATSRVSFYRFTYPASDEAALVFDLEHGGGWDHARDTHIEVVDSCTVQGWRHSRGWARNQKQFFYARASKPFADVSFPKGQTEVETDQIRYARLQFRTDENEQVLLKVALSATGTEGARKALEAELPDWDFEATRQAAQNAWREELSRIRIRTKDKAVRQVFYTALYHTAIAPSLFCDVDGSYRGADDAVHPNPGFPVHTTFSLWDTYRAAMPLYNIIQPQRRADFVNTMVQIFQEQGRLPVWHLMGNETDCMVGNPGVIAVADAIVKEIPGIDPEEAFRSCRLTVMQDDRAQDLRKAYGYIPADLARYSVAQEMEYAIADGATAAAADFLGYDEFGAEMWERSHSWRRYQDASTGFVRPLLADGSWRTPFDPFTVNHDWDDYCEGNAWQYSFLAPHDFNGLVRFFGSREKLIERLDSLFTAVPPREEENVPDMSGFIGQYVHGNEPSHHIIYLYTMAGEPGKAADRLREVMSTLYTTGREGLCGNEDVGQMSAWYILSALGFYQVEPASTRFWFGSPLLNGATLQVDGGTFRIRVHGNSDRNRYIQSLRLNGRPYRLPYLEYADIVAGGTLDIQMGGKPVLWYDN